MSHRLYTDTIHLIDNYLFCMPESCHVMCLVKSQVTLHQRFIVILLTVYALSYLGMMTRFWLRRRTGKWLSNSMQLQTIREQKLCHRNARCICVFAVAFRPPSAMYWGIRRTWCTASNNHMHKYKSKIVFDMIDNSKALVTYMKQTYLNKELKHKMKQDVTTPFDGLLIML